MSNYSHTPDDALLRMAAASDKAVHDWERRLEQAKAKVERCRVILESHIQERDDQFHALDLRDIAAPEPQS